jgi:tetratricopeptide (TPR) repeat protein
MAFLDKLLKRDPETLRTEADAAYADGDFGSAKLVYQRLLERLEDGQDGRKAEVRDRIDACQTRLVEAQLDDVRQLVDRGDYEAAVELARAAIEMADGLPIKTEVKARADALTEELTRLSQTEAKPPTEEELFLSLSGSWCDDQADELYEYGDEFRKAFLDLHQGRADEARTVFRRIAEAHPDAPYIRLELARSLVMTRRREGAAPAEGREAEGEAPADEARKAEATAALAEAKDLYLAYLDDEPEDASDELFAAVQSELAQLLFELGDGEGAEKALIEAADATYEQTFGHLNLGRFYRLNGRHEDAIRRLEIAVEKMGTVTPDLRVLRELGYAHRDAGHRDEAIDCLQGVVDNQASLGNFDFDPESAEALAEMYVEAGEKERASDLYRHLARGRNASQRFRYHLTAGRLLKEVGRKAEGVREIRAARALAPDDAARAEVDALLGGTPPPTEDDSGTGG